MATVSVVLTAHNPGWFLDRSLASVLDQTLDDIECVIVDDASDIPVESLLSVRDSRVRVVRLERNSGVAVARNVGVAHATSDLVAFLDHDDTWHRDKLARQHAAFEAAPDAWFGYTGFEWRFPDGSVKPDPATPLSYHDLLAWGMIHMSSIMVRTGAYTAVGGCNPTLLWAQDHDLHLRLLMGPAPLCIPEVLSGYHLHGENRSARYRQSVAFRKLVLRMHAQRARSLGDTETLRACERGMRRAEELYAAQAFDAARRARREGATRVMAARARPHPERAGPAAHQILGTPRLTGRRRRGFTAYDRCRRALLS